MANGLNTNHSNGSSASIDSVHGRSTATTNPILVLEPINDNFALKSLELPENTRVKIGRQTGVTTAPNPSNGYFDSKVLSRVHAEVWAENGKVFIRDVKSSNGTFLNGKRLSAENVESEPFVLNQNDHLEFGIDIMDENGSLLHEKVACKIYISRMSYPTPGGSPQETHAKLKSSSPLGSGPNSVKSSSGSGVGVAGQSTNIDLIISRLQNELTRSQETNADLGALKQGLGELERAILIPNKEDGKIANVQSTPAIEYQKLIEENNQAHAEELAKVNKVLEETQAELEAYIQKIQLLEPLVAEDEILRRDIAQSIAELTKVRLERDLTKDSMNELITDHQQAMECLRKEHEATLAALETVHKESLDCVAREASSARELLASRYHDELSKALEFSSATSQTEVIQAEEVSRLRAEVAALKVEVGTLQEKNEEQHKMIQELTNEKTALAQELTETKTVAANAEKELSEAKAVTAKTEEELSKAKAKVVETEKELSEAKAVVTKTEKELKEMQEKHHTAQGGLSALTPTSPTSTTVICKNPECRGQSDNQTATTTTSTGTRRGLSKELITRNEFSWAQFMFPIGKRDMLQPPQASERAILFV
ncbi:hypothetical protein BX616_005832, partial [Lobosporangium transversale]